MKDKERIAELEARLTQAQTNATFAEELHKEEKIELEAQLSDTHGYMAALEMRLAKAEADAGQLRAALEEIRNKRGVAPYDVARKALNEAESEGK